MRAYGANVDQLKAEVGGTVKQSDIEAALKQKKYRLITVTHVDTSTGKLPRDALHPCLTDIDDSCPLEYQSRRRTRSQRVTRDIGASHLPLRDYDSIYHL